MAVHAQMHADTNMQSHHPYACMYKRHEDILKTNHYCCHCRSRTANII